MPDLEPISTKPDDEKLKHARDLRAQSHYVRLSWLRDAQQAYAFKAGDQWTDAEREALEQQNREPMVWNYIHPSIELVSGVLTQNPIRVRVSPVEKSDGFLSDVVEKAVDWIDENQIDADATETEAFEDAVTTGEGYIAIDIQPRPDNPSEVQFIQDTVPVWQVRRDPWGRKADMSDSRYVIVERWVTLEDFKIRYPQHKQHIEEIFSTHTEGITDSDSYAYVGVDEGFDADFEYYDYDGRRVLICQMEYFEDYRRHFWVSPENPAETREITPEQAKLLPKSQTIAVMAKKVKWLHFAGGIILYDKDSPVYPDGFSIVPMFAYADKSKKRIEYYGIVKNLIDPQKECNRRWMQSIRMMANQGVGLMGEVDAFVDLDQAQESWSDPDEITLLNPGGMGKVQEKTANTFPDASVRMEEVSRAAMKHISGINPDLLGLPQERQEPGIVVRLRQQQGMTILSKLLRNYKRMKKALYKRKMHLVMKYMPDWQLQKILGETDEYVIQDGMIINKETNAVAPIRAIRDMKYNLKLEDAPGNMTKTMTELSVFIDMLSKGFPVDPDAVIDRLDISERAKLRWKKFVEEGKQNQAQAQQSQMQMQQAMMQIDMQSKGAKAQADAARGQAAQMQAQIKAQESQIRAQEKQAGIAMKEQQQQFDQRMRRAELMLKYKQIEETRKDNLRNWIIALEDEDRKNLEADLKRAGFVMKQISEPETA